MGRAAQAWKEEGGGVRLADASASGVGALLNLSNFSFQAEIF